MKRGFISGWFAAGDLPGAWGARARPARRLRPPAPRKAAPGGRRGVAKGEIPKKAPGPNRLNAPNGAVERLLAMPPEQRDRVLEKLPPAQQENLRRRFEQFDRRPPEERARLLNQWKRLQSLPPEKREVAGPPDAGL